MTPPVTSDGKSMAACLDHFGFLVERAVCHALLGGVGEYQVR